MMRNIHVVIQPNTRHVFSILMPGSVNLRHVRSVVAFDDKTQAESFARSLAKACNNADRRTSHFARPVDMNGAVGAPPVCQEVLEDAMRQRCHVNGLGLVVMDRDMSGITAQSPAMVVPSPLDADLVAHLEAVFSK